MATLNKQWSGTDLHRLEPSAMQRREWVRKDEMRGKEVSQEAVKGIQMTDDRDLDASQVALMARFHSTSISPNFLEH